MSETRPPITAGPIDRAFRFLKSTSVSCGVVGEGLGVAEGDETSCARKIETVQIERTSAQEIKSLAVISADLSEDCHLCDVGNASR
jgi:hypothetical protein